MAAAGPGEAADGCDVLVIGYGPVLDGSGPEQVAVDVDGFYLPWLREIGCAAILFRPDFYIFGTAETAADVPDLLADLSAKLDLVPEVAAAR
jgi:hypothetical protein